MTPDHATLKAALDAAARAHHGYESVTLNGVRDAQWSGFYAAYLLGRAGDFMPVEQLVPILEAAAGDDWSAAAATAILAA